MDRGPLLEILEAMKGTDKELDLLLVGEGEPLELRNVVEVDALHSAAGIRVTTKQNYIWLDATLVAACYQARSDM